MILRCIDVEDMRIQTRRQAKMWIDVIEDRLKRLEGYTVNAPEPNRIKEKKGKKKNLR